MTERTHGDHAAHPFPVRLVQAKETDCLAPLVQLTPGGDFCYAEFLLGLTEGLMGLLESVHLQRSGHSILVGRSRLQHLPSPASVSLWGLQLSLACCMPFSPCD